MTGKDLNNLIIDLIRKVSGEECEINTKISEVFEYYESYFVEDIVNVLKNKLSIDLNIFLEVYESDINTSGGTVKFRPIGNPIFVGTFIGDVRTRVESKEFEYDIATIQDFISYVESKKSGSDRES